MSARDGPCSSRLSLSPNSPASRSYRPGRRSSRSPRSPYRSPPYPRSNPPPSRSSRDSSSGRELGPDGSTISSRRPKKPPPPPPDRPGGAYDDPPPPPAPPANSASESLTALAFFSFFVSFTVAAAPSVGNDDASSSFAASPRDGNAAFAAGASSFASSVCANPAKTHTSRVVSHSSSLSLARAPKTPSPSALGVSGPRTHRISNRPHRPLRARDRAHALDRSIDRSSAFPIVPFARHPSRPVSHRVARASIIAIVHRARRRRRIVPRDARATTDARATDDGDRHRARWTR